MNENNEMKVDEMKINSVAGLAALNYGKDIVSDVKPGEAGSKFNGKTVPVGKPGSLSNPRVVARKATKGL